MTIVRTIFVIWIAIFCLYSAEAQGARQESDDFSASELDSCKWFDWGTNAAKPVQNAGLQIQTSPTTNVSLSRVLSQYMIRDDFSIEITVSAGAGFETNIPQNAQMNAIFGLHVDQNNYLMLSISKAVDHPVLRVLQRINGNYHMLPDVNLSVPSARLQIAQTGGTIALAYMLNGAWVPAGTVPRFSDGEYLVWLGATTIDVQRQFTALFQNFVINSGLTSYRPYISGPFFTRSDFQSGGVLESYIYDILWGNKWGSIDPLKVMVDNGMKWVKTLATTVSSPSLKNTPSSQWYRLGWDNSFWQSQEVVTEILKETSAHGMKSYLEFYFSNTSANAGVQNAPPEWQGLSVDDTAARMQAYSQNVVTSLRAQNIKIELYGLGNEIETGILNFRPGDRIPLPEGTNFLEDYDYMRNEVWQPEATLLKAAIAGIKAADPNAKFILHVAGLANTPSDLFIKTFYKAMVDFGVEFDFAGLSLPYASFPWQLSDYSTMCWFQRIQETSDFLQRLNKPIIISEGAYPHSSAGMVGAPMKDFPFDEAGQAAWIQETLRFGNNSSNVAGFYYFYPDWYPGRGNGNPSVVDLESYGLFKSDKTPFAGLSEFAKASQTQPINNCPATVTSDFTVHVPIAIYNGQPYSGDFHWDGNVSLILSNLTPLNDTSAFSNCVPATVSTDMVLHVPTVIYSGVSYWANVQCNLQGVPFRITGVGRN